MKRTTLVAGLALGGIAAILIPTIQVCGFSRESSLTRAQISQLQTALHFYEHEYGRLPQEAANAKIITTLAGENPRKLRFYVHDEKHMKRGEAVDAWGRPLVFKSTANGLLIRSAGKDGLYYTKDDISEETHRSPAARPTT